MSNSRQALFNKDIVKAEGDTMKMSIFHASSVLTA